MKTKFFTYRETIDKNPDRVVIAPLDYEDFPFTIENGGSYNIAPARVLGLSYATYLRFIRQSFPEDVSIEGKNSLYPIAYWRKGRTLYTFIDLLNAKMSLGLLPKAVEFEEGGRG